MALSDELDGPRRNTATTDGAMSLEKETVDHPIQISHGAIRQIHKGWSVFFLSLAPMVMLDRKAPQGRGCAACRPDEVQ
jgi:hypothetical protein